MAANRTFLEYLIRQLFRGPFTALGRASLLGDAGCNLFARRLEYTAGEPYSGLPEASDRLLAKTKAGRPRLGLPAPAGWFGMRGIPNAGALSSTHSRRILQ